MWMWIVGGVAWYVVGVFVSIQWWRKKLDFTTAEVGMTLASGVVGPFMLMLYLLDLGSNEKVIWGRRK